MQHQYPSTCCPYVQTLPDIARAGFPSARLLSPRLDLSRGPSKQSLKQVWQGLGEALGVTRHQVAGALSRGFAAWSRHRSRMRKIGERALAETVGETTVVLAGHPYQLHDPLLSFSIPVRTAASGATVIPADVLPLEEVSLGEEWSRVYWRANRNLLQLTDWLEDRPELLPVLMTAFACGPDAFASRYLQENRRGRPLLVLELDEHTAEAGLMTRLQAYLANAKLDEPSTTRHRFHPVPYRMKNFEGRTVYIPNLSEHWTMFKAAFLRDGIEAHLFPPTSLDALKLGRAWSSGRECNPFAYILGDILALAQTPGFDPSRARVFLPTTTGPCLLSQFAAGIELALKNLGLEDLLVDDAQRTKIRKSLRLSTLVRMWTSIVAVEVLNQLRCLCRPFERSSGAADQVHERNIIDLERSFLAGDVSASVLRGRERLQAVTGPVDPDRPQIAVVGDIFTRLNPVANLELYRKIEKLGCTVRVPPMFTDTNWHDIPEDVIPSLQAGDHRHALSQTLTGALQILMTRLTQPSSGFGAGAGVRYWAWSWWGVKRSLRGRLTHAIDSTMSMNVALAMDAVANGADGVINAICHNCMIGMVSDTVFKRLSEEPGAPPIVTLAFDGLQDTNTTTRLEAVCERAHLRKRERLARGI
jgi:predicted nucleotide-binding protein (sugar kinase/HSP70/actin superfamily)